MANHHLSKIRVTFAGLIFYWILPLRKQIVLSNIDLVFKNTATSAEKTKLAKAFYSHVASTLKELFWMNWAGSKKLNKKIEIHGLEDLQKAVDQRKGVFLLTGHLGSWELTSVLGSSHLIPQFGNFNIVRRPIKIKWLENLLFNRIKRYKLGVINSIGAPKKINQAIKNKELVLFAMDQHAQLENKSGIAVEFFGVKAGTYRSLAFFAHKHQTPVVPVSGYRQHNGKHVIKFYPEIEWEYHADKEQAIYQNTLRYNQVLEQLILEHPEQWWWVHRRWKL
ncbi:TPA: lipid A biosynthesis lauroyl acyltransferase [Legionella pneumophila subsp. pneumophila]|uniref:lysophospholipid acyltransferase family protein n=1 Tax=Legionella sp. PATHC039 TaxID=2992042 RepID=UPI0007782907|nr:MULTISPECIES: lysophospholipid acyltransferase family protein [Legionella]HAT8859038.1 lipid A biosynthesis lauroyl acyltransferase [Legionella pneumophila subsp. pneumophila]MCW8396433.1 lysophospholipid acyltransferase family protein [Legionella sp. PATHC039]HAT8641202.1 lipid A biosynthesis lauroyl acyltransferase [Legionella pneumophila]HAT9650398.1 lipid A biosynthesis lauroyl acyltransferase [Legionella pneumophila subsp. pneumophila]HAT9919838.1 lipid A biosynthesis lauroyl acyltrans